MLQKILFLVPGRSPRPTFRNERHAWANGSRDEEFWYAGGAVQTFQGGTFYFTSQYGTRLLQGAIRAKYENSGSYFYMGKPVTDEYAANATTRAQRFDKGIIYWSNGRTWDQKY